MKASREPIAHELVSVQVLDVARPRFDGPYHQHDAIELTWIRRGSGVRVVHGEVAPFTDGDLVLVPPRLPHVWWSRGDATSVSARVLHLHVPPALQALPEMRALAALLDGRAGAAVVGPDLHATVTDELRALGHCDGLERYGRALALVARITTAAGGARWIASGERAALPGDDAIARVLAWIHRDYARALTVDDGARLLHVAPASFSRAFRRRVGRAFSVYVNDVRIAEACLLLRHSRRPIADVARRCGFATLGHFHRQLVRRTALGPREYRRAFAAR